MCRQHGMHSNDLQQVHSSLISKPTAVTMYASLIAPEPCRICTLGGAGEGQSASTPPACGGSSVVPGQAACQFLLCLAHTHSQAPGKLSAAQQRGMMAWNAILEVLPNIIC